MQQGKEEYRQQDFGSQTAMTSSFWGKANQPQATLPLHKLPNSLQVFLYNPNACSLDLSNTRCQGLLPLVADVLFIRDLLLTSMEVKVVNTLIFQNCQLTVEDIPSLDALLKHWPTITTLDLSQNFFGTSLPEIYRVILGCTIKNLSLRGNGIAWSIHLENFISACSLTKLDLSQNSFSTETYMYLIACLARRNTNLEIGLNNMNLDVVKAKQLISSRRQSQVHLPSTCHSFHTASLQKKRSRSTTRVNFNHTKLLDQEIRFSFLDCLELTLERQQLVTRNIELNFPTYERKEVELGHDHRFRIAARKYNASFSNTLFDNRFLNYNISQLECGYFLAEGPGEEIQVQQFLEELIQSHATINIKYIIVVGNCTQGEQFIDYFSASKSYDNLIINSKESLQRCPNIREYELELINRNKSITKKTKLIHLTGRYGDSALLTHEQDDSLLYDLCVDCSPDNILLQCDTSLGYAPMVALSMHLFRSFTQVFNGHIDDVVTKLIDQVKIFRRLNAAMLFRREFLLGAINLCLRYAQIHHEKLLAVEQLTYLHPEVKVPVVLLCCNITRLDKLSKHFLSSGVRVKTLDYKNYEKMEANIEQQKQLLIQVWQLQLLALSQSENFNFIFVAQDFPFHDLLIEVFKRIPKQWSLVLIKETDQMIKELPFDSVVDVYTFSLMLRGMAATNSTPRTKQVPQANLLISPLNQNVANLIDSWKLQQPRHLLLQLIPAPILYAAITAQFERRGANLIIEIPELKLKTSEAGIELKEQPVITSVYLKTQYVLMALSLDTITSEVSIAHNSCKKIKENLYQVELTARELVSIGESFAIRANALANFHEVTIIIPEQGFCSRNDVSIGKEPVNSFCSGLASKLNKNITLLRVPMNDQLMDCITLIAGSNDGPEKKKHALDKNPEASQAQCRV